MAKKTAKVTIVPKSENSRDSRSDSDSEDDGVDEAGMERLMHLLGEDGLNEFDAAQLDTLNGEGNEEDESVDEDDDEGASGSELLDDGAISGESDDDESEEAVDDDEVIYEDAEEEEKEPTGDLEELALDDVSSVDEDAVPRQKITINNKDAMRRLRENIQLDPAMPWTETLVVSYPQSFADVDHDNDLERELAFYKQALHGATTAKALASKHSLPFSRPPDYFAEMVKSDSHMERIRQKLLDETAGIKKSEDARKQRELKKFGKQVQVEKLKERVKDKKDMEDRLKTLKRKRGKNVNEDPALEDDDGFDIAVESAIADRSSDSKRGRDGKRGMPRSARDSKFGFGGGGRRRDKQNTRESTNDFGGGSSGRGRGGRGFGGRGGGRGKPSGGRGKSTSRPGKSRREASRH